MQGENPVDVDDVHSMSCGKRTLLQSEVISFFAPVADKLRLKDGIFVPKPRRDIVEETKLRTKTITVRMNSPTRLERTNTSVVTPSDKLNTNHSELANGLSVSDTSALMDGTRNCSSTCSPVSSNGSMPHNKLDNDAGLESWNVKRQSIPCGVSKTPNRKSLFTKLIRRLSTPRIKTSKGKGSSVSVKTDGSLSQSESVSNGLSPQKSRKWFARPMWKSTKNPTSQSSIDSQSSLVNVNPDIQIQDVPSAVDNLSQKFDVVIQDFRSVPVPRKRIILPNSVKSAIQKPQNSSNNVSTQDTSTESNVFASVQSKFNNGETHTKVEASTHSNSSLNAFYHSYASKNDTDNFLNAVCSSPQTTNILRCNSIRSAGSKMHRFDLPVDSCEKDNEVHALHQSDTLISQSYAKTSHCTPSNYPVSPLTAYTPSYLNASLAAFGYTGYGSTSKSAHNLIHTEKCQVADKNDSGGVKPETVNSVISNSNLKSSKENDLDCSLHTEEKEYESPSVELNDSIISCNQTESGYDDAPVDSAEGGVKLRRKRTTSCNASGDDKQHWNRSSLIMLAVAHASPRSRVVTPSTVTNKPFLSSLSDANHMDEEKSEILDNQNDSPPQCQTETADRSPRNIPEYTSSTTECPKDNLSQSGSSPLSEKNFNQPEMKIDGNYYLEQVDQTERELLHKVFEIEKDLNADHEMDDEVSGLLRTACGQTKLLISEKFSQFRGLCHQNLSWEKSKIDGTTDCVNDSNTLVTLISDLDGFWAMVSLQVDEVRNLFKQVDCLRANQWKMTKTPVSNENCSISPGKQKGNRRVVKSSVNKKNDTVARQQARQRLEQAKRNMQLLNSNSSPEKPVKSSLYLYR
ncbi:unnamed protein product [Trichobilharzia szidati]|nr:unnamed protein product [Trichobilharzia szidati]